MSRVFSHRLLVKKNVSALLFLLLLNESSIQSCIFWPSLFSFSSRCLSFSHLQSVALLVAKSNTRIT